MRTASCLATFTIFPALFAAAVPAAASRIPLGINSSHGIFVQEIWQGNRPFLCLANRSGKDRVVQVSRWRSRQVPADPLLQWELDVDSAHCYDASSLAAEWLLEFKLVDGEWLGLLKAPRMPAAKAEDPSAFSSFLGPNSRCPTPGTWVEQSSLWLKAGELADLTLQTTVRSSDALMEFPVDSGLNLPHLQIKSATSSSLVVKNEDQRFSIKAGRRATMPTVHRAQLVIDVPPVTEPTMYLLSGRKRIASDGWQCFIRGILVEP